MHLTDVNAIVKKAHNPLPMRLEQLDNAFQHRVVSCEVNSSSSRFDKFVLIGAPIMNSEI
jgi:hypothetical protein